MSNPQTHVGSVAGTAADLNVICGFQPDYVLVVNVTTMDRLEWFRGSAGAIATSELGAAAADADGIAALDSTTEGEGFTIDAAAVVNVNGNTLHFLAIRSGPGAN